MRKYKTIGYVSTRHLADVRAEDCRALDVINLAFGHVIEGRIVYDMDGKEKELERIRRENPDIKIVLSIGGWSADGFSQAAATEEGRELFARTALEILETYGLDGVDLDWEYPCMSIAGIAASPADKENFTLLLQKNREVLDAGNREYLLTIAAGGDSYYTRCTDMAEAQKYLDYVQLMTYDLRGGFCVHTGHHANLYTRDADLSAAGVDTAVKCFLEAGVPAEKLIVGAAYYSRIWKEVPDVEHGMMQMAGTTGGYGPAYTELVENYIGKNGFVRYWDEEAQAPWLFDGSTFISYEDEASISAKAAYVREKGLGGLMFWEYGCDETRTLTEHIRRELDRQDDK